MAKSKLPTAAERLTLAELEGLRAWADMALAKLEVLDRDEVLTRDPLNNHGPMRVPEAP